MAMLSSSASNLALAFLFLRHQLGEIRQFF